MTTFPSGFADAVSVTGTDYLLVNNRRATVNQLGAVIGGGSPLAEWNGTDLTQFDAAVTSGFTNPALSVVTSGSSKTLSFTADAAAAGAYYVRWFSDSVPMRSMNARAFIVPLVRTSGDELFVGLAFAGSTGSPLLANTVVIGTDNTDTTGAAFGAYNGPNAGTGYGWTSGASGMLSLQIGWMQSGSNVPAYTLTASTSGIDAAGFFTGIPSLPLPAVDAAWASSTPNKVGIFVWGGNNGASNPLQALIWDIVFEAR